MSTKTKLADDIYLYSTRSSDPVSIYYEVECSSFRKIEFTLSIAGSQNFAFEQDSLGIKKDVRVSCKPGLLTPVARVVMVDKLFAAKLSTDFSWVYSAVDDQLALSLTETAEQSVASAMESWSAALTAFADYSMTSIAASSLDYSMLISICRQFNCNFVDVDFPPTQSSIGTTKSPRAASPSKKRPLISWRRPVEFMPKGTKIEVFKDGIFPGDIKQGKLHSLAHNCLTI